MALVTHTWESHSLLQSPLGWDWLTEWVCWGKLLGEQRMPVRWTYMRNTGFPLLIFEKGAPLRQIQGLWEGSVTCHYQLQDVTFFWWATDACIRTPVLACIVPSNQRDRKHGLILSFWTGCWYQVVMTSYFVETIIFGLWGPFTEECHLLPSGYHISWHCSQCRFRDGPWKKLTIGSQEFPLWYKILTQNLSSIPNIRPNLLFSICSAHECSLIPPKRCPT